MILIALGLLLSLSCFALAAFIGICAGLAAGDGRGEHADGKVRAGMNSEPLGRDWQHPYILPDLARAILVARQDQQKIWAKMIGLDRETHTYEVWPGGRNVRWSDEMLERRRKRAEIQPARRGPKEKNGNYVLNSLEGGKR